MSSIEENKQDNNQKQQFYAEGLCFECQRCGGCCGKAPGFVYLSKEDLQKLCEHTGLKVRQFVNKYCRFADYYEGKKVLALKEQKNYDCIFFDKGCTVYKSRPIQCSTYPFWTWMVESKESWDEVAKNCPGMNKGLRYDLDFINNQSYTYSSNTPITKEEVGILISKQD